ncbi:hypothetical protein QNI16_29365 [Cytophagaceae bacterium YF14B1]|uniref:Uncharacterized protein n=1 Tax=Xanthocytophaga flava TaxID=3048013 RepID=A0AAE3QXN3_9BACT|nr:hypothetical protein [Xanthocytophaga flavus]MDJ1484644.1 hypothetical protein [Xanthocytophaga flavus]
MNDRVTKALMFSFYGALLSIPLYGVWFIYIRYEQWVAKNYYQEIKDNPKIYTYQILDNNLEPVFYITDLDYAQDLRSYYDSLLIREGRSMSEISYTFPTKLLLTPKKPLLFIQYVGPDSSLVEFINFNLDCYGYWRGYADRRVIHFELAPDSLVTKLFKDINNRSVKNPHRNFTTSPFGWQCD